MPIAPQFRRYYGHRWRTVVRPRILERAGGVCEACGRCPRRLEVAHLDQHPPHDDDDNLAAYCITCHRRHDYASWKQKSRDTRGRRKDLARPLLVGL